MVLHYYGINAVLGEVWREGGIHNVDIGTFPNEIEDALDGLGVPSDHFRSVTTRHLQHFVRESRPPIALLRLGLKAFHYVVVVGYKTAANGDVTDVLIADPNGDFKWWDYKYYLDAWSLRNTDFAGGKNYGTGGAFITTFVNIKSAPYTMIVPKAPPTSHFKPYWSEMRAFTIKGQFHFFPVKRRNWTKTVTFDQPFDFYTLSAFEPVQWKFWEGEWNLLRFGNSSIDRNEKVGDKSVKVKGTIADGWVDQGTMWVVLRAYSETPPLEVHSFTVSGISNGTSITSGEKRTISVYVKSQHGTPIGGVWVRFEDTNDKEISFSTSANRTNSSGRASTTLYTGSEGSADFTVKVDGLQPKSYNLKIVGREKSYDKTWKINGTIQTFCFSKRKWEVKVYYFKLPETFIRSTLSRGTNHSKNAFVRNLGWNNSTTMKAEVGLVQKGCFLRREWVQVRIAGRYKVVAGQRPIQGAPSLTPELDTLSEYWQDLSQVPIETDVFTNYPNPFNPETWIPYQLATPAEVTVDIYAVDGQLVRTLSLGHQLAGMYQSKSRAAYWDGRNAQGEPVANGVYFYTLTAGDFMATRKMLVLK